MLGHLRSWALSWTFGLSATGEPFYSIFHAHFAQSVKLFIRQDCRLESLKCFEQLGWGFRVEALKILFIRHHFMETFC